MIQPQRLSNLLESFSPKDREFLLEQAHTYDQLLKTLLHHSAPDAALDDGEGGILALNGASGVGQSYVLQRVEQILQGNSIELPRIYLLGTRPPREGEGHKSPYIFVEKIPEGYRDVHHPDVVYSQEDIYYAYQSRPGAENAILMKDVKAALDQKMYLETVIPTLLHMKMTPIKGIPAWGEKLIIVYLAAPSGAEWLIRLLNREPSKLAHEKQQRTLIGRVRSSMADMETAAEHGVHTVINHHEKGQQAAREILSTWGL